MTLPLQARGREDLGSSFVNVDGFQTSYAFFGKNQHLLSMASSNKDIANKAKRNAFSYNRDPLVLSNTVGYIYKGSVYVPPSPLEVSELSETHVSLYEKEGCFSCMKRFFLRILAILKKFFCMEKRTKSTIERKKNFKRSLLEKKKRSPSQETFKYILIKIPSPVLVNRSTQTFSEEFLTDTPVVKEQKAFYISLMLKDMWINEEKKNLSCYTWCVLTMLTQCLQDFYKFFSIEEKCLMPSPHVRLSDELYLEWEQCTPKNEDLVSIICALLETLNGKVFSTLLEEYEVSESFIEIAKRLEESLPSSQLRIVLALIARHCMIFTSRQARDLQRLFVISAPEAAKFVNHSLLLLSQVKEMSLITWIGLMQILANDAVKD